MENEDVPVKFKVEKSIMSTLAKGISSRIHINPTNITIIVATVGQTFDLESIKDTNCRFLKPN